MKIESIYVLEGSFVDPNQLSQENISVIGGALL